MYAIKDLQIYFILDEKLQNIEMEFKQKIQYDINQEFAKRLAKNLYNYLDSFNQN